jgi:hypothetical protein
MAECPYCDRLINRQGFGAHLLNKHGIRAGKKEVKQAAASTLEEPPKQKEATNMPAPKDTPGSICNGCYQRDQEIHDLKHTHDTDQIKIQELTSALSNLPPAPPPAAVPTPEQIHDLAGEHVKMCPNSRKAAWDACTDEEKDTLTEERAAQNGWGIQKPIRLVK